MLFAVQQSVVTLKRACSRRVSSYLANFAFRTVTAELYNPGRIFVLIVLHVGRKYLGSAACIVSLKPSTILIGCKYRYTIFATYEFRSFALGLFLSRGFPAAKACLRPNWIGLPTLVWPTSKPPLSSSVTYLFLVLLLLEDSVLLFLEFMLISCLPARCFFIVEVELSLYCRNK